MTILRVVLAVMLALMVAGPTPAVGAYRGLNVETSTDAPLAPDPSVVAALREGVVQVWAVVERAVPNTAPEHAWLAAGAGTAS